MLVGPAGSTALSSPSRMHGRNGVWHRDGFGGPFGASEMAAECRSGAVDQDQTGTYAKNVEVTFACIGRFCCRLRYKRHD